MFFFQAEDGIRYLVRSRGLGDVYKRQQHFRPVHLFASAIAPIHDGAGGLGFGDGSGLFQRLSLIHI